MRDAGLVGSGFVFGWLMSKTWSDPGCRRGSSSSLVATAVMFLAFISSWSATAQPPAGSDHDDVD